MREITFIDGPSGVGKTTYAAALSASTGDKVVHLDDFYPGWSGLSSGTKIVEKHVLGTDNPGYRRWDWVRDQPGNWVEIDPNESLIIDGAGCLSAGALRAALANASVRAALLDAPEDLRRERAFKRDPGFVDFWQMWADQEAVHFAQAQRALGEELDQSVRIAALVICDDAGRLLHVRKHGTGDFQLPGGKLEDGESPSAAALRECSEELGVEFYSEQLAHLGRFSTKAAHEPGRVVDADLYLVRAANPAESGMNAAVAQAEIAELMWCSAADQRLAPLSAELVFPLLRVHPVSARYL